MTNINITAAWAVDREFIYIVGPTGRALGSLWSSFGLPLAPFGSLWGALGLPLAVLWAPFGSFGVPLGSLGCLWDAFGFLWPDFGLLEIPKIYQRL